MNCGSSSDSADGDSATREGIALLPLLADKGSTSFEGSEHITMESKSKELLLWSDSDAKGPRGEPRT
jgi:hypothetical protein